ncbi:hypothetical protein [Pelagovum pacificum]|uniref:Transporter n=1 Tax=Pelagovum pacificum TaxID=2588711 RepID=A0A5C5GCI2_9RHOB|nr:hypothetical protein [Pelagovum pacificum]QQA42212.1 hypothetical protein I8N54_15660 [Pelagovum pacificum]TNY31299.1 hypothetical protein FHY64_14850 [Pelagovum pacificum]
MFNLAAGLILALLTSAIVIVGDYVIKVAADGGHPVSSRHVVFGAALYAVSAIVWFLAMRHVSLGQAAVAYSMFTLIGLCVIGAVAFDEPLSFREIGAIGLAVAAMVLMSRA